MLTKIKITSFEDISGDLYRGKQGSLKQCGRLGSEWGSPHFITLKISLLGAMQFLFVICSFLNGAFRIQDLNT